jgi:DHHC palmitoyltransferase
MHTPCHTADTTLFLWQAVRHKTSAVKHSKSLGREPPLNWILFKEMSWNLKLRRNSCSLLVPANVPLTPVTTIPIGNGFRRPGPASAPQETQTESLFSRIPRLVPHLWLDCRVLCLSVMSFWIFLTDKTFINSCVLLHSGLPLADISLAIPILQGLLFAFLISNLTIATCMDPGFLPRAMPDETPTDDFKSPLYKTVDINGVQVRLKWCVTCNLYRPPRTSHCSNCNRCIEVRTFRNWFSLTLWLDELPFYRFSTITVRTLNSAYHVTVDCLIELVESITGGYLNAPDFPDMKKLSSAAFFPI